MKKTIHADKAKKLQGLLIKARKEAGLTQQELAEKLNKHQSFVAKYEGGERRLDVIEVTEICQRLGLKASDIIKDID